MKLRTYSVALLSFLVLSSQLLAFDGQRKGFILGGGIGGGYLHYVESYGFPVSGLKTFAVATNFKIGYAPSNSLEIYYINSVSWFGYSQAAFIIGVTGLGLTKYLNPNGTGFFVSGGIGLSFYQPFEAGDEDRPATGFGLLGGIGYDIAKHWSIQGDILYTTMNGYGYGLRITSLGVRATLNFLAF